MAASQVCINEGETVRLWHNIGECECLDDDNLIAKFLIKLYHEGPQTNSFCVRCDHPLRLSHGPKHGSEQLQGNLQESISRAHTAGTIKQSTLFDSHDHDGISCTDDECQMSDSTDCYQMSEAAMSTGREGNETGAVKSGTCTNASLLPADVGKEVSPRMALAEMYVKEEENSEAFSPDANCDQSGLSKLLRTPSSNHQSCLSLSMDAGLVASGAEDFAKGSHVSVDLCSVSAVEQDVAAGSVRAGSAENSDVGCTSFTQSPPTHSGRKRSYTKNISLARGAQRSDLGRDANVSMSHDKCEEHYLKPCQPDFVDLLKMEDSGGERDLEHDTSLLKNMHWPDTGHLSCQGEVSKGEDPLAEAVEARNGQQSVSEPVGVERPSDATRWLRSSNRERCRAQERKNRKQFSFHKPASSLKNNQAPTLKKTKDLHLKRRKFKVSSVGEDVLEKVCEGPVACPVCNKLFSHKKTLRCHMFIHTGEKPYVCQICNVGFRQSSGLRNHLKTIHTAEKQVMCQHCPFNCKTNKSLKQHIILRHSGPLERTFRCKECSASFLLKSHLQRHELTHSGEKPHVCDDCGYAFSQKCNLKKHVAGTHHKNLDGSPIKFVKKFMCDICGKTFFARTSLVQHKVRHTAVRPYNCDLCSKSFKTLPVLKQHQRNLHNESGPYPCKVCEKCFGTKAARNSHMKAHSANKPFVCETCGKAFKLELHLLSHETRHSDSTPLVCEMCDKSFTTKFALYQHKQTHSANTEFLCETCGKSFKSRRSLRLHEATHSESRRHVCELCNKSFKTNIALYSHKVTHTADKNFVCETCGKAFKRRSELKKHEARHSESRPHTCEVCEKSFKTKYCLQSHRLTHTVNKSVVCETCGKVYKSQRSLVNHEATHSDKKPHTCEICEKSFISGPSLKRHMLLHNRSHVIVVRTEYEEQVAVGSVKTYLTLSKAQLCDYVLPGQ